MIAIAVLLLMRGDDPNAAALPPPAENVPGRPVAPTQPAAPPAVAWEALPDAGTTLLTEPMFPGDGVIRVIVVRAGAPVEGADVRLYFDPDPALMRAPEWRLAGRGATGPDGVRRFDARVGQYVVAVRHAGTRAVGLAMLVMPDDPLSLRFELSEPMSLVGTVSDEATGAAIAGAQIVLGGQTRWPPEETRATVTDAHGGFLFAGVNAGDHPAVARADGYPPKEVYLTAGPAPVAIVLSRAHAVAGVVLDGKKTKVPGALVTLARQGWSVSTLSGPDGRFLLAGPDGELLLGAEKDGQASLQVPATVGPGSDATPITLTLRDAGGLAGQVVRKPDAAAVAGATVTAHAGDALHQLSRRFTTITDADGRFALTALPPGPYVVVVTADSQCDQVAAEVAAGKPTSVQISLEPSAWIDGDVVDGEDKPVAHAVVELMSLPNERSQFTCRFRHRDTRSDEAGRFRLSGLAPGRGHISARYPFLRAGVNQSVTVAPAAGTSVRLVLGAPATLRGTVRAIGGGVLGPNAVVETMSLASGQGLIIAVKGDGTYALRTAPGNVTVRARYAEDDEQLRTRLPPVRLEAGKETVVDLELGPPKPRFTLKARIVDSGGAPVAAHYSYMLRDHGSGGQTVADGRFEVSANVSEAPDGVKLKAWTDTTSSEEVVVKDFSREVVLTLRPARTVEGRVRDLSGRAVEQFSLVLRPYLFPQGDWKVPRPFEGDSFAFQMPPIEAELEATLPDGRVGAARLPASADPTRLDLVVGAPASIRLRVVSANDGTPVAGMGMVAVRDRRLEDARGTSGPDGVAVLKGLRPGDYEVSLFVKRGLVERYLTLAAGQQADLGDVPDARQPSGKLGALLEPVARGLRVVAVPDESAAQLAGLDVDDVLVEADGHPLKTADDVKAWVDGPPGTVVQLTFLRDGNTRHTKAIRSP